MKKQIVICSIFAAGLSCVSAFMTCASAQATQPGVFNTVPGDELASRLLRSGIRADQGWKERRCQQGKRTTERDQCVGRSYQFKASPVQRQRPKRFHRSRRGGVGVH